jgi:hypothetical protein
MHFPEPSPPQKPGSILNPEATEVFGVGRSPDQPATGAGTSDYTRIISPRPAPPAPLRPPRVREAEAPAGENQPGARNRLILTLILLGLLAVGMILVFALKS